MDEEDEVLGYQLLQEGYNLDTVVAALVDDGLKREILAQQEEEYQDVEVNIVSASCKLCNPASESAFARRCNEVLKHQDKANETPPRPPDYQSDTSATDEEVQEILARLHDRVAEQVQNAAPFIANEVEKAGDTNSE